MFAIPVLQLARSPTKTPRAVVYLASSSHSVPNILSLIIAKLVQIGRPASDVSKTLKLLSHLAI